MKIRTTLALFLLALGSVALHAKPSKMPIAVNCTVDTDDYIGHRLCSALRDHVASSPRYYEPEADPKAFFWVLNMVSVATEGSTSQAVELTIHTPSGTYVSAALWVYITGNEKVQSQADAIFAAVDDKIEDFAKQ
jgi:hypothetical protein